MTYPEGTYEHVHAECEAVWCKLAEATKKRAAAEQSVKDRKGGPLYEDAVSNFERLDDHYVRLWEECEALAQRLDHGNLPHADAPIYSTADLEEAGQMVML